LPANIDCGKTTLPAECIAECRLPVVGLSLDKADNDPARFEAYLLAWNDPQAALRHCQEGVRRSDTWSHDAARRAISPIRSPTLGMTIADTPAILSIRVEETAGPVAWRMRHALDSGGKCGMGISREFDHPIRYRIIVKGGLDAKWSDWFDGFSMDPAADDETLLLGPVADQAALHGLLNKIRDLGLPLVSVMRDDAPDAHAVPGERYEE
jgi:hypothetical protein